MLRPVTIDDVLSLVGNTPLVRLGRLSGAGATVWGKCEMLNPGGSVKDRIALTMVEAAEARGSVLRAVRSWVSSVQLRVMSSRPLALTA